MKESTSTSFKFSSITEIILFLGIACKSFGGTRKQQSCFWRSFTSGSQSEMHKKKGPFFFLFWTSKKDKKEIKQISKINNE